MIGTTLGKFRVEAQVSSGGMGTIYRAVHVDTGQSAAVKVLQSALAADRSFLQRFRREVLALQKVQHPNVVRIYDVGSEGSVHYYAMEYLDRSLADLMRAGPLGVPQALRIASQVARGLGAVHAAGVRHRDVKPSNVLFDAEGNAKITDFGIAKLSDATRVTQTGVIVGTPTYMAPEQVDETNVGPRADLYSLGVVLYEMIVGRPPFDGSTTLDILRKHRYTLPEAPKNFKPELPASLDHLILAMLAKDASRRPDTAALVADALDHIAANITGDASAGRKASAPQPSTAERIEHYERVAARVARWSKRVGLALAAALFAYLAWRVVAYWRLTPADYWRDAHALEAAEPNEAIAGYEALISRFPDSPEAVSARERIRAIHAEERLRQGKTALPSGVRDPSGPVRTQIAYMRYSAAEAAAEAGRIEDARRIYRMVRQAYADTPWGARADSRLQELDQKFPKPPEPPPPGPGEPDPQKPEAPQ
ncbi:MAG: serine/threonine protein kinase [Planctomycetes bacterium]|nr:serine/threonine protein kinase [Planctomycetota bacterium]